VNYEANVGEWGTLGGIGTAANQLYFIHKTEVR